jgi:sulfur carrier protein ThiS
VAFVLVSINDETFEVDEQTTVGVLLESLGFPDKVLTQQPAREALAPTGSSSK